MAAKRAKPVFTVVTSYKETTRRMMLQFMPSDLACTMSKAFLDRSIKDPRTSQFFHKASERILRTAISLKKLESEYYAGSQSR